MSSRDEARYLGGKVVTEYKNWFGKCANLLLYGCILSIRIKSMDFGVDNATVDKFEMPQISAKDAHTRK